MPANPDVLKRLSAIETRVKALELRAGERQLGRLTDNPATVEHAFALRRIVELSRFLAVAALTADGSNAMAGEVLDLLDAMGA